MDLVVRKNRRLSDDCLQMEVEWPAAFADPLPGQFVMVRTRTSTDPLWRRPFGVHDFRRGRAGAAAQLLYQVVGPTTRDLADRRPGETIDLVGPLGKGFSLDGEEHLLVAGGRGIAPLFFLARRLRRRRREVDVLIGGAAAGHVLKVRELQRMGFPAAIATEDGSLGKKGLVTALLEKRLRRLSARRRSRLAISACGPEPMLKRVGELAARAGVPAHLSLDTLMACGQGYCQGCTVSTSSGYRLCCQDGPVFTAGELAW
jgi:dihydroorotate dehydrogenase electron transfer subunit